MKELAPLYKDWLLKNHKEMKHTVETNESDINAAVEKVHNNAYNQGIDHAFQLAKTLARKNHGSVMAFLLDLSVELADLKKIQSKPICEEINETI